MSAEITKVSVRDMAHGWIIEINHVDAEAPTPVVTIDRLALKGVLISCPGPGDVDPNTGATSNTVPVYIGGAGVKAEQDEQNGGVPVSPGRSFVVPIEQPNQTIYAKASIPGQKLAWMLI